MSYPAEIIEEVARAWASIDGQLDKFELCKADEASEEILGYYGGYTAEAEELLRRSPKLSAAIRALKAEGESR